MNDEKKYRLFAFPLSMRSYELASVFRYCRVTPEYTLVYSDVESIDGGTEIPENELTRLSKADQKWLITCFEDIFYVRMSQNADSRKKLSEMVEMFETELKEEQKRLTCNA